MKDGIANAYYILLAVIFHQGNESNGHYFSVMRSIEDAQMAYNNDKYHAGNWIHCNDRTKEVMNFSKFNNWINSHGDPTPYQCIYYKVDQITSPTSLIIPSMI